MELEKPHASDLNRLVESISAVRGVVGIVLFGSFGRGDYDRFSDYDLLILFESRESLWRGWDSLFDNVGKLGLNVHAIPQSIDELRSANPVFLGELEKYGKVLFARTPFKVFMRPLRLETFYLISYSMSGLDAKTKMRVLYQLYEQGGKGAVPTAGGAKVGDSCILIPASAHKSVSAILTTHHVSATKIVVRVDPREIKEAQGRTSKVEGSGNDAAD